MKRRLEHAGRPELFTPDSFRVTVVRDLLTQNVPGEDLRGVAGQASATATRIFHRRKKRVVRNIVERNSI